MNALLAELALIIQELDQIVLVPLLAQEAHALEVVLNVPIPHLLQARLQDVMFVQALIQGGHAILVALVFILLYVLAVLALRLIQEEEFIDILELFIV
jgi:hypothetical protein